MWQGVELMQDKRQNAKRNTPVGDYRALPKIGIITGFSEGEAMRKSFRKAAFSWLRSLFKQSARRQPGATARRCPRASKR